jgi:hypothetical protein
MKICLCEEKNHIIIYGEGTCEMTYLRFMHVFMQFRKTANHAKTDSTSVLVKQKR